MGVTARVVIVFLSGAPEYVLLKPSPTFFPPEGVPNEATTRGFSGCCDHSNQTIAVRFIADAGEFIEVETLGTEGDRQLHCGATFVDAPAFNGQLRSYKLRVRVRRSDVATVLRRPLRTPTAEVAAGVPVEFIDGGLCGELASTFVRAGATVYWPDGRIAGVTRRRDGLWGSTDTDAGMVCSDVTLQGIEVALPLCFRAADVFERPSK